jgi:nucleoside-diphosphate kinase
MTPDESHGDPLEYRRPDDPDGVAAMFGCVRCGALHTTDLRSPDPVTATRMARQAAIDCSLCRTETMDPEALRARREDVRRRAIDKADKVTDLQHCFSDRGDGFYTSPAEAADAGETGVFGARFQTFRIDAGALIEGVTEDTHEDASVDDLNGVDELCAAIEQFNRAQTRGWFEMDDTKWQSIPHTQTFGMIKPDATARGVEDAMIADIEAAGFRILDKRRLVMTRDQAEWLYREHSQRDHFKDLVDYTISGEVVMMLIEGDGDNVPADFRRLMGATDRTKAEPHTLRARYAVGYRENSVHGSDSPAAAIDEIIRFMR